jgi:hypothetical protein
MDRSAMTSIFDSWDSYKVHDLTGIRSGNVYYVNNSGRVRFVNVSVTSHIVANNTEAYVIGSIDSYYAFTVTGITSSGTGSCIMDYHSQIEFPVSPKSVYSIFAFQSGGSYMSVLKWIEMD